VDRILMLASIFGPFLAILGIWRLLYAENFNKVITSIKNTPGALYLQGIFNLLIGLFIVNEYNVWDMHIPVLITLLGWVMIAKGVLSLFVPQAMLKIMTHKTFLQSWGLVPLIVGLILCWFAFSPQQ
jgi:uncharacterized protein YjeT (DUF2065 family)